MKLTFCGAAGEVTGSCTLVETERTRVLIDCGMFQGGSSSYVRNLAEFPFDPKTIDAVILTHAHVDHTGRVPRLVAQGFSGRIFSTHPTRLFSRLMWEDTAHVMKDDARRYKRPPLYVMKDVGPTFELTHGVDYHTQVKISDDISFTLRDAGHIFGSAFVEMQVGGIKTVFSGDLGNDYVPILKPTERMIDGDVVVMESTYGDRVHEDPKTRIEKLKTAVKETIARKGTLMIPAFSLERTQEILYELNFLVENGSVPQVPIFLDSPLAIKALQIYHQFPEYYDREAKALADAGDDFFKFPGLRVTKNPEESREILEVPPPKVIIAGSGMMHGGRIMHHLVDYLNNKRNTVLVVGYQSAGTLGRAIFEGAKKVHIDHQEILVRAQVEAIGAYSAHADRLKLAKWVTSGLSKPSKVYLNHGEPHAAEYLADAIRTHHDLDAVVPRYGEIFSHG
ncbi:MBL fold metallo-hydrolase [Candidatus Uhrbacteria bacterium]|nr:MBL fold metallo-hydrolase [Candidatus Uhrbacteria bacterium]